MISSTAFGVAALGLTLTFTAIEVRAADPTSAAQSQPQMIDDSQLHALSTTVGGASVLRTTRTVQHWFGSTLDPHNGITYGYNMVGADSNNCIGSACSATITADIIPLNGVLDGMTFSGEDVLPATLVSPVFAVNDYGSTPFATAAGAFPESSSPRLRQGLAIGSAELS